MRGMAEFRTWTTLGMMPANNMAVGCGLLLWTIVDICIVDD